MSFKLKAAIGYGMMALIFTIYNGFIPLHPDEAYYWLWSTRIDWSYYDHPGMVAWMIRLFSFFGDSEPAVRFTAVFSMALSGFTLTMLAYRICLDYFDSKAAKSAGLFSFISFNILPATAMGYVFVTPDSPLILFWCLALYSGYMAVRLDSPKYYIFTGLFIALMITGKYTAVLFPFSLFVYMLVFNRRLFSNKYVWLACFIGACGVIPIIIWNMHHDWISIKFQYTHGTSEGFKVLWDEFFILLGGIQLLPTPLYAFIIYKAVFYVKKFRQEFWWRYLSVLFVVPTAFFLYKGLFKKMELNWPIVGFLSAIPLMSVYLSVCGGKKLFRYGTAFAAVLTFILVTSPFLPYPDNMNIAYRIKGTRDAVLEVEKYRTYADGETLFSNHLTNASMMSYYLKGHPVVHIPVASRFSQFDIWDEGVDFASMSGIYFGNNKSSELIQIFGNIGLLEEYSSGSGKRRKNFYIYYVHPLNRDAS